MRLRVKALWAASAFLLAACGSKDGGNGPGPAAGGTETASASFPVDANDPGEFGRLLNEAGIENPAIAGESTQRGGAEFAGTIFPIYPRGDVRAEGLGSYRIDIDVESFQDGGTLEFRQGKKVLWKSSEVFAPKGRVTTATLPRPVADGLRAGDEVTWGVFYDDRKKKDVTAEFKVVAKGQLTKSLAALEANKKVAAQSPLVRTLARAKLLQNGSIYCEALAYYLDAVEAHPSISEAWKNIVECMRRLDLKKTPLFEDALLQMSAASPVHRAGGGLNPLASTDVSFGTGAANVPDVPAAMGADATGATGTGTKLGPDGKPVASGDGPAAGPTGGPAAGASTDDGSGFKSASQLAYEKATAFAARGKEQADAAKAKADADRRRAEEMHAGVEKATRLLASAKGDAEIDGAKASLAAAEKAAAEADAMARGSQKNAENVQYTADQAARAAKELWDLATRSASFGGASKEAKGVVAAHLRGVADTAAANAKAQRDAMMDAKAAAELAGRYARQHTGDPDAVEAMKNASRDYQEAKDSAEAALRAAYEAEKAAKKAEQAAAK